MQKPSRNERSQIVKYTPKSNQIKGAPSTRIMQIVQMPVDPLEPPKFKHKKLPPPPPSPPAPVMHSPPRKVSAEEQKSWRIPPCVSSWKNPKGFTIPLDKRLATHPKDAQGTEFNERFSGFSESLGLAEKNAKEEIERRAVLRQRLAEKAQREKEEQLRRLAEEARRPEKKRGEGYKGEEMFDARLFNRSEGVHGGFNDEDAYDVYDKPLYSQSAANAIYRPRSSNKEESRSGPVEFEKEKIKENAQEEEDVFGIDQFLSEATNKKQRKS